MSCTKTGALVHFLEYNQSIRCDIYQVGDCNVVRFYPSAFDIHFERLPGVTHEVTIGVDNFWRKDLGILVVPKSQLKEVSDE